MVNAYTGLAKASTIDTFTERSSDTAAFAAGLVEEPEVDEFADEGGGVPPRPIPPVGRKHSTTATHNSTVSKPRRRNRGIGFIFWHWNQPLELLRTGTKVKLYFSVETSPTARRVQYKSWAKFISEYPLLCNRDTFKQSHGAIPKDVQLIEEDVLAALPSIDLITAGWECQGHSKYGQGMGQQDHRSITFLDLVRIITLCQEKNNPEVGCFLKNENSSEDARDNIVTDFQTICYVLGTEVVTDAARHNSCAHRLKAFWTPKGTAHA